MSTVGVSFEFEIDKIHLRLLEKKLDGMKQEIPNILRKAVNDTAKQARIDLAKEAQKTYTVKRVGFKKAIKMKNASRSNLTATLTVTGAPLPLNSFKIEESESGVRAKVLKKGSLKPLEKGGIKAFVGNVARKDQVRKKDTAKGKKGSKVVHIAVAQRETRERLPIKTLWSNSVPKMVGNEARVYGIVKPNIQENLQKNIHKQIDKILGGK